MGGSVGSAPARYGSNLGSNPDISQIYKNGRLKQKSGQHTPARQKHTKIIDTCMTLHGKAVEWYSRRIVPCMEMGPRTNIIQC